MVAVTMARWGTYEYPNEIEKLSRNHWVCSLVLWPQIAAEYTLEYAVIPRSPHFHHSKLNSYMNFSVEWLFTICAQMWNFSYIPFYCLMHSFHVVLHIHLVGGMKEIMWNIRLWWMSSDHYLSTEFLLRNNQHPSGINCVKSFASRGDIQIIHLKTHN